MPDPESWELGAAAPGPASVPVRQAAKASAASPPELEVQRRRYRRHAARFLAGLALLGGMGACAYLLANAPSLDDAGAMTSGVSIYVGSSAGTGPSTTTAKNTQAATGPVIAGATLRFLTYDATSGKYGYADETGSMVIDPRFDRAGRFSEGLAPVQLQDDFGDSGYGYIDATGAVAIEPQYSKASAFSEGLARVEVEVDGLYRYGFIDRSGTMVIVPRYTAAWDFSEGLAAAAIEGQWGYIDRTGAWVIEPQYYDAKSFMPSGLAWVDLEGPGAAAGDGTRVDAGHPGLQKALIDKTGRVVSERQEEQGQ